MMTRSFKRKAIKTTGLLLTILAYLIIFSPILVIFVLSINNSTKGYSWDGFTLRWYRDLFLKDVMKEPIMNTLGVALMSTLLATALGTIFAIGINALEKKKRVQMMVVNNIPVVNPDIVTGISLMIVFSLLSFTLGYYTVLLAHVFFSIPYVVLSVMPRLKKLDSNLYEAALDLGCSRFSGIFRVIIPNISTGILSGALMAFTMSIDDFIITYFTSGAEYMNVSTWLYATISRGRSFTPAAYAYNIIIFTVTIGIIVFINLKRDRKEKIT
jgi:spermidine/putrescine transport system permease protein